MDNEIVFLALANLALFIIIVLVIILFLNYKLNLWRFFKPQKLPFKKKIRLMSATERVFFWALIKSVAGRYNVFAKVRLADVVVPSSSIRWKEFFYQVTNKHVDFVLVDRQTSKPLLIIELDDRSHLKLDRQARDAFVNRVLESAELPVLRIKTQKNYEIGYLSGLIKEKIS